MKPTRPTELDELLDGLDGVTPGPWREMHTKHEMEASLSAESDDWDDTIIARFFHRAEYGENGAVNAAHVARCDPDTIRKIGAHVDAQAERIASLEAENERLRGALEQTIFAAETTETCLRTWNDNKGGPANVEGIIADARAALDMEGK